MHPPDQLPSQDHFGTLRPEQLVERAFDAFSKQDLETFLKMTHADVEVMLPTAEIANAGRPYVGHDGIRDYFRDVADIWEELRVIPQLIAVQGDVIVVIGRAYARGAMGITDTPAGWVVRQSEGRMHSLEVFWSRQQALDAGGVTESDLQPL
jgi:ketosteroid isomerase-like protein